MAKKRPKIPAAQTIEHIERMSRGPFREILSEVLNATPTVANLRKFANKSPDRWAQMVTILSGLSGYASHKVEIEGNITHTIAGMSDSQLREKLALTMGSLGNTEIIEGEIVE